MTEQMIILVSIIITLAFTLCLYIWKAKKEVEYKKDERWLLIQNKANNAANYLNYLLIILLVIGQAIILFLDTKLTLTFDRVLTIGIIFIGCRNAIELIAIKYFDKKL